MFSRQSPGWLAKAAALDIPFFRQRVQPVALGRISRDPTAFQGWKFVSETPVEPGGCPLPRTVRLCYDFGRHCVGFLTVRWSFHPRPDAPFQVRFRFAELPAELGETLDSYSGPLGEGWLQQDTFTFDEPPAEFRLPRRYAFRYLQIEVRNNSTGYTFALDSVEAETVSSADPSRLVPIGTGPDREIDRVSLATLSGCMQQVFEDGPKRDRRLWNGDLRLQALVDSVTTRNFPLVKRCLYLFAGLTDANGMVPSSLYHTGKPEAAEPHIFDYTALFALIVAEYAEASGDWETAAELWPVVLRQAEITTAELDRDGMFQDSGKYWLFIDWCERLDRTAAEQGAMIRGLRVTARLAARLGRTADAERLFKLAERCSAAARRHLYDPALGCFISGPGRQVSWASQAYLVLAEVLPPADAARALKTAMDDPGAVRPGGPYLTSYVTEALIAADCPQEAHRLIQDYWGKMVELGADTFWEVFDPADQYKSPYSSILMNSACHAWSCTPSWFYRILSKS